MNKRAAMLVVSTMALGLAAAAWAADRLNVKTGQWEMTMKTNVDGQVIPQEVLDKMTPEQRAGMEKMLAAQAGKNGLPHVLKSCVTQEELDKGISSEDTSCKKTVIKQTSTHQEMELECSRNGRTQKGRMTVDAPSNDRMTGLIEMDVGKGKVTANMSGKWLAASCPKEDQ